MARFILLALAVLGLTSAQPRQRCEACAKDSECGDGLACDPKSLLCKPPEDIRSKLPTCDAECASTPECRELGWCTILDGSCVPSKPEDCARSPECLTYGKCQYADHKCVLGSDADCEKSLDCKRRGRCHLRTDPDTRVRSCVPLKEADCQLSTRCRDYKACHMRDQGCVPLYKTDTECQQSADCKLLGQCHLRDGECIALTASDCAVMCWDLKSCVPVRGMCAEAESTPCNGRHACQAYGDCHAVRTPGSSAEHCAPTTKLDCLLATTTCKRDGFCAFDGEQCRLAGATDEACSSLDAGRANGWLSSRNGICQALTRSDCSELCEENGACTPFEGNCISATNEDCAKSRACELHGRCTAAGEVCVATPKSCESSVDCRVHGACAAVEGKCTVTPEGCAGSNACAFGGRCKAIDGECRAGSEAPPDAHR